MSGSPSTRPQYGLTLAGEEHPPADLVRFAGLAERYDFDFVMATDHYQPWTRRQGNAPFVWSVLGGVAATTSRLTVGTGVVCPTMRMHPAMVAQAAATTAALMPGRFVLGVGSGGLLNEHILGLPWPTPRIRLAMLEEAIGIIRALWTGRPLTHRGRHFTVDAAQLWSLPPEPPPLLVAASGRRAAALAGRAGDGLIATVPDAGLTGAFDAAGGAGRPRYGWLTVCWDTDLARARRTAHLRWPIAGLSGALFQELRLPGHVEDAVRPVREEDVARVVPCGPDPGRYLSRIRNFLAAGFTHVYLHQIGPDQDGFVRFWRDELRPRLP